MSTFDDMREKGEQLAQEHDEQIDQGLDKAGDALDQRTGGEHGDQIDQGVDRAKGALDQLGGGDQQA